MGEVTHVVSLKFKGGGELLDILHNVMQRPVGHDQRASSTNMLWQANRKGVVKWSHTRLHLFTTGASSQC